jgi:glycosyltransferase involved in cell wall biosynthesis
VRLLIKASSADRIGNRARLQRLRRAIDRHPNIEVRVADLSRTDLYGLISACDGYVSLHRSEGFGYTCAEAMSYGKPVVATGYSGNMQFMDETNSYPVRYREVEASVQDGPFVRGSLWAEPDVAHAAELMRRVYENRADAIARGIAGVSRSCGTCRRRPSARGCVRCSMAIPLVDQMAGPDARPGHIA